MTFYRVNNPNDKQVIVNGWILVHNELFTESELKRKGIIRTVNYFDSAFCKHKTINTKDMLYKVEVSKFDTYWFFGARFQNGSFTSTKERELIQ